MSEPRPRLRVFASRPGAILPRYASPGAAGLDLHAAVAAPVVLPRAERVLVPTGLSIALPSGHEAQVRPRSGLAAHHGVTVLNAPGTIDEDYRGEVQVLLVNHGPLDYVVRPGDRIAQLVIAPVTQVAIEAVDDAASLGSTPRGNGGFGSTGR